MAKAYTSARATTTPYSRRRSLADLCLGLALVGSLLAGCSNEPPLKEGRIRVRNDTMDRSYNVVRVQAGGSSYSLSPGEFVDLRQGVRFFTLSREYADHTRRYTVQCPQNLNSGISVRLLDAHLNRLPGGCKTVSSSD